MVVKWSSLILLFVSLAQSGAADAGVYSADSDVRKLAQINGVGFGGIGFTGSLCSGEVLMRRILRKEDPFKCFVAVYNTGTPAAKVYALAYFHHSAPELFEICWRDNIGKYNPVVVSWAGCLNMEGSFLEHMMRIREGEYDPHVELALERARKLSAKYDLIRPVVPLGR